MYIPTYYVCCEVCIESEGIECRRLRVGVVKECCCCCLLLPPAGLPVLHIIYVYSVAAVSAADNNHTHLFDYEQRRRAPSKFSVNCEATKGETSSTAVHLKHFMIFVIMEHKCTEVCAIIRYFHIYLWLRLLRAYCHSE